MKKASDLVSARKRLKDIEKTMGPYLDKTKITENPAPEVWRPTDALRPRARAKRESLGFWESSNCTFMLD